MLLSRSPSGPKKYFPIPVAHLEEEIRVRSADDCKRFREEFNVSGEGRLSRGVLEKLGQMSGEIVPETGNSCTGRDAVPEAGFWRPGLCGSASSPPHCSIIR